MPLGETKFDAIGLRLYSFQKEKRKLLLLFLNFIFQMVNVAKGSLIKCDPAVKQYLVHLDEKLDSKDRFILNNLDDQHLFVQTSSVPMIKKLLQEQIDKISYDAADAK